MDDSDRSEDMKYVHNLDAIPHTIQIAAVKEEESCCQDLLMQKELPYIW
jgi:hypothetical protein